MMKKRILIRLTSLCMFLTLAAHGYSQMQLNVTMTTTPACSLDGTASVTVSNGIPPYSYQWYGPMGTLVGTTSSISGLHSGAYWVQVSDANQSYGWASGSVGAPFNATMSTTDDVCNTGVGTATASVTSGGTPPFTYLWSTGQTGSTISGLNAGNYEVTITDAAGCFIYSSLDSMMYAYVGNSSPITLTMGHTNSACNDGTASVTSATGGTAPYTYVWNTVPVQYTSTVSNLAPGSYQVTVTDATGCDKVGYVFVTQLPNGLNATVSVTPETCVQGNGAASISVSGGTAPYTYLWSNGATTSSVTGLSYGHYTVTATDINGCPKVKHVYVGRTDPLTLSMTAVQPNCAANGSLQVNVTGGTGPYTYLWNTGATTASITGLNAGYYYVSVTDANGCADYTWHQLQLAPNCYATISGQMVADLNADCAFNGTDFGVSGEVIQIGSLWATTNSLGNYSRTVLPGSYTISQGSLPTYYAQMCPAAMGSISLPSVMAGGTYSGNNFYDTIPANINDLRVWYYATAARTTSPQTVTIYFENAGSTTLNATVNFTHDVLMTLLSGGWNMSGYNLGTRTLTYNLGPLAPGQAGTRTCTFTIPTNTPVGTAYAHNAEILPISGDQAPGDNVYGYPSQTVGSYDPNQKSVQPGGLLDPDVDSLLYYTIEFQNTGNDTAFTVAIRDTLDANLDALSLEVLGASHSYTWDMEHPGYVTFTFDHILLPDSFINEPASHGWIAYRIRLKDNLPLGSQIHNRAAIYFDYNAPIITNTTVSTLEGVSIDAPKGMGNSFALYPNPTTEAVQLQLHDSWEGETEVRVMDLSGKLLLWDNMSPARSRMASLQVQDLPAGVYLVECRSEAQRAVKKLVIQ